ncbi:MAG: YiiX/YebB-like N1pC/P60 family cysteine hydrolase, partial [Verrucomicrobiales bacterium]
DEADSHHGLPRKTFSHLYRATTDLRRLALLGNAVDYFESHEESFRVLRRVAPFDELIPYLRGEVVGYRGAAIRVRRRLSYRWFSFRRRHRSAWKVTVFGLFQWSGSLIAELKQPGVKPMGATKRVDSEALAEVLSVAQPGDVFFTRHDDAMSNLFLPGYWPHAALYIGSESQRAVLGLELPPWQSRLAMDPSRFIEAKKDGVRFRPADETLAVDRLVVLRAPVDQGGRVEALKRAAGHVGKRYDFVFDFRSSDRLACTEVIYRAYHGQATLRFKLQATGGRLCLPAEVLIQQALEQKFRVVAAVGIGKGGVLKGREAELALHQTRCGI